jgi:hypothetical protein
MEGKNVSLLKSSVTSGVVLGLVLVIYAVILFILGLWLNTWLGFANFIFFIGGIIWAVRTVRTAQDGSISFGLAFLVGFITIMVSSIISTAYNALFYTVINPDAIEQVINKSVEMMENFNIPEEVMEEAVEKIREETTVSKTIINGLIYSSIFGAIIALITAAAMKKDKTVTEF